MLQTKLAEEYDAFNEFVHKQVCHWKLYFLQFKF